MWWSRALAATALCAALAGCGFQLRGHVRVPRSAAKDQIEQLALASEAAQKHLQGQTPKKVVVVPGRLVNVVV